MLYRCSSCHLEYRLPPQVKIERKPSSKRRQPTSSKDNTVTKRRERKQANRVKSALIARFHYADFPVTSARQTRDVPLAQIPLRRFPRNFTGRGSFGEVGVMEFGLIKGEVTGLSRELVTAHIMSRGSRHSGIWALASVAPRNVKASPRRLQSTVNPAAIWSVSLSARQQQDDRQHDGSTVSPAETNLRLKMQHANSCSTTPKHQNMISGTDRHSKTKSGAYLGGGGLRLPHPLETTHI